MDPEEPSAPWFDDLFDRLADNRSAALRRRLAATRTQVASLIAAERLERGHPDAGLTPDLFVDCVPALVLEVNVPASVAAARSYVSAVSRLVDAAAAEAPHLNIDRARREVRAARQRLDEDVSRRPDDPWATRIPRRLLQGPPWPG